MARSLRVEIVGDARSLERSFARASKATKGFGGDMRQANRHVSRSQRAFGSLRGSVLGLAGGFVGVAGLSTAVHAAFSEMADAQKVSAQTNAALKSTGGAANVTAKHIDALAESLLNVSGTDDEVIKSGENLLLTFTSIRNEVGKGNDIFDQATRTALDMSTALGQDMKSSAIQLGKALQDPIKGITALRRVGVNFTDAQKDQIKALVKSGQTLKAQKVILAELNKEFGGSARAAGQTLPGKLNILRETALNLAGSIAQVLTPSITRAVNSLVKWLQNSKNQKTVLDTVRAAAAAVSTAVKVLTTAFQALNGITGSTKNTFKLLLGLFVAFKALKLVSYIARMTTAMRAFGAASAVANAESSAGALGGGRAGRVGRLGKFARAGKAVPVIGTAIVAAEALRAIHGPTRTRGGVPAILGDRGHVINIEHFHSSAQNPKQMEQELTKRSKQRRHTRRAAP